MRVGGERVIVHLTCPGRGSLCRQLSPGGNKLLLGPKGTTVQQPLCTKWCETHVWYKVSRVWYCVDVTVVWTYVAEDMGNRKRGMFVTDTSLFRVLYNFWKAWSVTNEHSTSMVLWWQFLSILNLVWRTQALLWNWQLLHPGPYKYDRNDRDHPIFVQRLSCEVHLCLGLKKGFRAQASRRPVKHISVIDH